MTIIDPNKKIDKDILLKQYELMVKTTEGIFRNRIAYNSFFITIITAFLGYLTTSLDTIINYNFVNPKIILLAILVFINSIISFWLKVLKQFNLINTAKFEIIDNIEEEQFSSLLFKQEYTNKKNKKGSIDLSKIDISLAQSLRIILSIFLIALLLFT